MTLLRRARLASFSVFLFTNVVHSRNRKLCVFQSVIVGGRSDSVCFFLRSGKWHKRLVEILFDRELIQWEWASSSLWKNSPSLLVAPPNWRQDKVWSCKIDWRKQHMTLQFILACLLEFFRITSRTTRLSCMRSCDGCTRNGNLSVFSDNSFFKFNHSKLQKEKIQIFDTAVYFGLHVKASTQSYWRRTFVVTQTSVK